MAIEVTSGVDVGAIFAQLGTQLASTAIAVGGTAATDAIRAKLGVSVPQSPIVPANTAPVTSAAAAPAPQAPVPSPGTGPGVNAGSSVSPVPSPDGPGWSVSPRTLALAAVVIAAGALAFKFLAK